MGWLEGGKVCEVGPVPAREQDVLHLNIAVVLTFMMTKLERIQELKDDPPLLNAV